jgi:hypothetical protein
LAWGEKLLGLQDFRALQMAELGGPPLNAGPNQRQGPDEFGVQIPLHHLRCHGRRTQAQAFADPRFHCRRNMRARPDRTGEFPHRDCFARAFQAAQGAAEFIVHQRHFQSEGRRLRVDAVAAADHGSENVLGGLLGDDRLEGLDIRDENGRRLRHLHGEGSVKNIAAGQPVMEPAAGGRADVLRDVGGEGDDVVIERAFQLFAALRLEGRPRLHHRVILLRHDALGGQGLAGEQFDLEPYFQLALLGPDFPHFGA